MFFKLNFKKNQAKQLQVLNLKVLNLKKYHQLPPVNHFPVIKRKMYEKFLQKLPIQCIIALLLIYKIKHTFQQYNISLFLNS